MDKQITERLANFSVWKSRPTQTLKVRCKNHYGDVAYFRNYAEGVVLIGFGDKEGIEPDKDALKIDKKDLPAVIEFLQGCLESPPTVV